MDIFESWLINTPICKHGFSTELAPENTEGAYLEAIKNNYAIMISVQILKDDAIVCFGDKTLARLTKQSGYITNLNLEEVKQIKLLNSTSSILTLEEAFKIINGKVPVLVNIIGFEISKKIETNLLKILKEYNGEFAIMSRNPDTLIWFKDNAPSVIRGINSGFYKVKTLGSYKARKLKKLKYNKFCEPDFICYAGENLPNRFVKKYKTLPIIAYNVKNEAEYLKCVGNSDNVVFDGFVPTI